MKNRVRYICVPVTSFELADALPEHEKAVFIEQVLHMFKTCEAGDDPAPEQTENRVLDIALEGAAREIKKGYDSYVQKMTARTGKTETADQSANDQRSIGDQPANRREKERDKDLFEKDLLESSESSEMPIRPEPLSEIALADINKALQVADISPDDAFYTFAKKAGHRITVDAIRRARDEKSRSLAYVVKIMKETMERGC